MPSLFQARGPARLQGIDKMVALKLQKRLAASVLGCGRRKVWMDPSEVSDISTANSRECSALVYRPESCSGCTELGWDSGRAPPVAASTCSLAMAGPVAGRGKQRGASRGMPGLGTAWRAVA